MYEGKLVYPDGRVFTFTQQLQTRRFDLMRWVWAMEDGSPILGIELKGARGEISLDPELPIEVLARKAPPLLLFLGWYLILLWYEEGT